ncbi:MAG: PhzF family phenazine biosynthesis protein, partial [Pyrinomonadaceae bacterium]
GKLVLDFPAYPINEIAAIPALETAIGARPLKTWESQTNMVIVRVDTEATVRALQPDMNALLGVKYDEIIVTALGDDCDFASRMFAPRIGIPEDPVTGAIHCSLIPYWAKELSKDILFARQVSGRGGELFCELAGDRVKIGGDATLFLKGEIYVEAGSEKSAGA